MDERLTELENQFSFQEALLNELNEVLIKQQRQLDSFESRLTRLQELVEDISTEREAAMPSPSPAQEKPPHY